MEVPLGMVEPFPQIGGEDRFRLGAMCETLMAILEAPGKRQGHLLQNERLRQPTTGFAGLHA